MTPTANNTEDTGLINKGGLAVVQLMNNFWKWCVLVKVTAEADQKGWSLLVFARLLAKLRKWCVLLRVTAGSGLKK
jgi:hypothetical protein